MKALSLLCGGISADNLPDTGVQSLVNDHLLTFRLIIDMLREDFLLQILQIVAMECFPVPF